MNVKAGLVLWCWWVCGAAVAAALNGTPCLPNVTLEGASLIPHRAWKHVVWHNMQVRAKLRVTNECRHLPEELEYCWHLDHRQKESFPPPVECDLLKSCSLSPVSAYAAYSLAPGNYTFQALVRLPGKPEPRHCITSYFVMQPTETVPFAFGYGSRFVLPQAKQPPLYYSGLRNPDLDPSVEENKIHVQFTTDCFTDDEQAAQMWCINGHHDFDTWASSNPPPGVKMFDGVMDMNFPMRSGYSYNFSTLLTEKEWPHRSARMFQEMILLKTGPAPHLEIVSYPLNDQQRLLTSKKIHLSASCKSEKSCLEGIPIKYTWSVEQEGVGPVDLTIHSEQAKDSGVEMKDLTLLPGALQPDGIMVVQVRAHYYPTTPDAIRRYQEAAEEISKFQETRD